MPCSTNQELICYLDKEGGSSQMKGNNAVKFIVVIAVIAILTWIAATGPTIFGQKLKGMWDINKGVDIRGGVRATLSAPNGTKPTSDQMDTLKAIIRNRLDSSNIFDAQITPERNNTRLSIEIPWAQNEKDYDPQKLINKTIQTALLTFRYVDEKKKDANNQYLPLEDVKDKNGKIITKNIILQGNDIKGAGVETNTQTGKIDVTLQLDAAGTKKFAVATAKLAPTHGIIAIFMDEKLISYPGVNTEIPDGNAIIEGNFTTSEAKDLAATIRSGALPFKLNILQVDSISSLLGENAFNVSVIAMGVALLLVWVFMLVKYRLMGILANIALLAHTVIQVLFISWMGISVTLPGIAGIILTIGMGVDANIIIFERIKEELRSGKTLRASVDVGFKRAFTAVFDANMTTLISAVILYMFNSGPIKSFAITLIVGVVLSFLTAVIVSRIMLKSVIDIDIAKHPWLYGVTLKAKEPKEVKA